MKWIQSLAQHRRAILQLKVSGLSFLILFVKGICGISLLKKDVMREAPQLSLSALIDSYIWTNPSWSRGGLPLQIR